MTATMRAARIVAPERIAIEDVAMPLPSARQIRFRVEGSGVCASNLGPWLGLPWIRYPLAPGESGHEAWGVVDRVGADVTSFREGDRIAAISYAAYAEYDVVEENAAVRLPAELAQRDFPGEPLGCAMNIFERARVEPGQTVAVIGVGFLGALLTRLCSLLGATVVAVSRQRSSLELAREFGAHRVIPLEDHASVIRDVGTLTGGRLCDRVIEATGKQSPLDLAAELAGNRALLVVAGYHQDGPRRVNMQLWNWRGIDVINAHERDLAQSVRGVRAAIAAVVDERLPSERLYTHRYALEELGTALSMTSDRPPNFVKALVYP